MSQPKRYRQIVTVHPATGWTSDSLVEHEDGLFVKHADYAALQAEVERLANEVGLMNQLFEKHLTPEIRKAIVNAAKEGTP